MRTDPACGGDTVLNIEEALSDAASLALEFIRSEGEYLGGPWEPVGETLLV